MLVFASAEKPLYEVVVNIEGQYSVWMVCQALPPGWQHTGVRDAKINCLNHINSVWTDMRPRALIIDSDNA